MTTGVELLTAEEMRRADALSASAGVPTLDLMRTAGRAVADAAVRLAPNGRILVVAGRGNNGGDGFIAARELAARDREVEVMLLCSMDTLKGDAAVAAREWHKPLAPFSPETIGKPALIIDALFGSGLSRPVRGAPGAIIAVINTAGVPVLSIDIPSGIDSDSGAVLGEAVRATETVTFFRRKPGHLLLPGRIHCGRVVVSQIGIPDGVLGEIAPRTSANGPELWRDAFPIPKVDGHKYSRGHAVVLSGSASATGAARMAARAALRAGAGLVTVASPNDALAVNAAALTAVMVRAVESPVALQAMLEDQRINALVIGPGVGLSGRTREMVLCAAAADRALVLDADALTSFAENPDELFAVLTSLTKSAILTPHAGEFKHLFKEIEEETDAMCKLKKARNAAQLSSAVVVLKGPDTVIAAPDGRAAIANNAPPWLATAGSGDVLGGIIAGMLAQGVRPFEAACMGVWLHGEAGREVGPGLIAEDLPDALPLVFRRIYKTISPDLQA